MVWTSRRNSHHSTLTFTRVSARLHTQFRWIISAWINNYYDYFFRKTEILSGRRKCCDSVKQKKVLYLLLNFNPVTYFLQIILSQLYFWAKRRKLGSITPPRSLSTRWRVDSVDRENIHSLNDNNETIGKGWRTSLEKSTGTLLLSIDQCSWPLRWKNSMLTSSQQVKSLSIFCTSPPLRLFRFCGRKCFSCYVDKTAHRQTILAVGGVKINILFDLFRWQKLESNMPFWML